MSSKVTIRFVRNYTIEPVGDSLVEAASNLGLIVHPEFGAYDNLGVEIAELAAGPESPAVTIVTIDLDYFSAGLFSPRWDRNQALIELERILSAIDRLAAKSFVL